MEFPDCPSFNTNGSVINLESNASGAITRCIQKAAPGTTIIIPAGEYRESLVIDKEITIQGDGDVFLTASPGKDTVTLCAPFCVVRGIQILPGVSQSASPVKFVSGSALIESCVVSSEYMPPISVGKEGNLYFTSCSIQSNEAAIMYVGNKVNVEFNACAVSSPKTVGIIANGNSKVRMIGNTQVTNCGDTGLIFMEKSTVIMDGCVVSGNGGDAIELNTSSAENTIANSVIANQENGTGINCNGAGSVNVESCNISSCSMGILATNGFTVECIQCEIHDMTKSALVCATTKANVTILGGQLYGTCLLGVLSERNSTVTCERVKIENIETTGASVTGGSKLVITESVFENITQAAIEAHDDATLEVDKSCFASIQSIGILIQNNVKGFVKDTEITDCAIVGIHYVDNDAAFEFEGCRIGKNQGNGLNVKNTAVAFTRCEFFENTGVGIEAKGAETKPVFTECTFQGNEYGIMLSEDSSPVFQQCKFEQNTVSGALLQQVLGAQFVSCQFTTNNDMGVYAYAGSQATFQDCQFVQNGITGAHVENEETSLAFEDCKFYNQEQGGAVVVNDFGNVSLNKCEMQQNAGVHVQFQNDGKGVMTQCLMCNSAAGISVMLSAGGNATIQSCTFYDETQSAIVVSQGGVVNCETCDISRCQVCGVYMLEGSSGTFTRNKIHDNGTVGFQIMDGSPAIIENEIFNHEMYGINIGASADPQVIRNEFSNNGIMDVNRE